MAYRRYKKRFYKRYGRKRGRTSFSRYSTYRYRSSKSQASQIYRLNRRISKIEKSTKPEILTYDTNDLTQTFHYDEAHSLMWKDLDEFFVTDSVFNDSITHKSCRIKKVIIYGVLARDTQSSEVDIERDPSSFVRLLVLQHKDETKIPTNNTVLNDMYFIGDNGALDYTAPLKPGASTHDRILKYKRYKITSYTPNMIQFKFNVYPYYNVYTKAEDITVNNGKGSIYVAISAYQHGSNTPALLGSTKLTLRGRIIYYDN